MYVRRQIYINTTFASPIGIIEDDKFSFELLACVCGIYLRSTYSTLYTPNAHAMFSAGSLPIEFMAGFLYFHFLGE